jgi:zinc/manganese transport system substrate-binding protein
VPILEVPGTRVDRSGGDVHPLGNPHFSLDPGLAPVITQNIVDGLVRLPRSTVPLSRRIARRFLARLDTEMTKWTKRWRP